MYVRIFHLRDEYLVVASFFEGRIAVASLERQSLLCQVQLPEPCPEAFSLDADAAYLVVAYQTRRPIDIWRVPSSSHDRSTGRYRATHLMLDQSGQYAVIARGDRRLVSLSRDESISLPGLEGLYGALLDDTTHSMWVPLERRGAVGRVWFDQMRMEIVPLHTGEHVWTIRRAPDRSGIIMLRTGSLALGSERGCVECLDAIGGRSRWRRVLRGSDVTANGSYSGDSKYFLLNANEANCVIVIDAWTGAEVNRIPGRADPAYPLPGPRCMTSDGQIVDAEAGVIIDAVNQPSWWRVAGLTR